MNINWPGLCWSVLNLFGLWSIYSWGRQRGIRYVMKPPPPKDEVDLLREEHDVLASEVGDFPWPPRMVARVSLAYTAWGLHRIAAKTRAYDAAHRPQGDE